MIRKILLSFTGIIFCLSGLLGQAKIIDEIVAVVGDKRILYSDIEKTLLQYKAQGEKVDDNTRCSILEQLLVGKLLLNQAEVDSLEVTDSQVENELDSRMKYFVNQMGSEEKLENYFGKSIIEIKEDLRKDIHEQLLVNKMRGKITEDISVTPADVKEYYKNLPPDSIPYINSQVEFNQIVIYPFITDDAKNAAREKLLNLRERILNGENFATLAVIYSQDPGSAVKGGDIGWSTKAELDPEYAKAAFALKPGGLSRIVESSFGYHIIQCLERTDDRVHTRHILIRPDITTNARQVAISKLDSLQLIIRLDSLKFDLAAKIYSQDVDSRINGGQVVNPNTGGTQWTMDELDQSEYNIIENLKVGDISDPFESTDNKGITAYKIIWLKSRTSPHVANLKQDYNLFKERASQIKNEKIIEDWVSDKIKSTYIHVSDRYKDCPFVIHGWF